MNPNGWILQMFGAQIVEKEGIVRRRKRDVHRYASFKMLHAYGRVSSYEKLLM